MSNQERIRRLEDGIAALTFGSSALRSRVEALESAVTLTDMGWATAEPEPSPHPDVLGKVEPSGDSCPIGVHSPGEPHVRTWADTCVNCGTGLAPLPAPPTEPTCGLCGEPPKGSASINGVPYCHGDEDALSCYMWAQADANPAPPTEPALEPSPDTVTAEWLADFSSRTNALFWELPESVASDYCPRAHELILAYRAALNSTPDPLLVGLVDACRAWRFAPVGHGFTPTKNLAACIDAYLAEQEGDR